MKLIEQLQKTNGQQKIASDGTSAQGRRLTPRRLLIGVAGAVIVALVLVVLFHARTSSGSKYVTQPVARQDLIQTVTASGTVNPQNTISVGTQDSGTINAIFVDFNSVVKKGQVLATLDPQPFQAALDQAQATLAQTEAQAQAAGATAQGSVSSDQAAQDAAASAQAQIAVVRANAASSSAAVSSANADLAKAQSAHTLAQQTYNSDSSLLAQGYVAQNQVNTDRSNLVAAQAGVNSAQAALQQARLAADAAQTQIAESVDASRQQVALGAQAGSQEGVTSADAAASQAAIGIQQAEVQEAQLNLQRAVITSPVNGTVIARDVSVGETVAASLQTPTLFSIAQDLSKMEVDVAVGENDIGNVKQGAVVNFTVLAYPARTFEGVVAQVRQNPTVTNNVVTYDTVVLVENSDGSLLPGMTANASIQVAKAPNALVVPLQALSYRPAGVTHVRRSTATASPAKGTANAASGSPAQQSAWGKTTGVGVSSAATQSKGLIFVLRSGKPQGIPVTIELVSGAQAAVTPTGTATLSVNDQVILSDGGAAQHTSGATSRSPLTGSAGNVRVGGGGGGGGGPAGH
jgi:HlyD family secretion protein